MTLGWLATYYFPLGLVIGLVAAAPIGPVNIIVIQRSLRHGMAAALAPGLGAALGDMLFAAAAGLGLTALQAMVSEHQGMLRIAGGLVMIGFAVAVWRAAPRLKGQGGEAGPGRAGKLALATFAMTVTNPATLLWFAATFGAVGLSRAGDEGALLRMAELAGGVFAGSMLWWLGISGAACRIRGRLEDRHLALFNHGAAVALLLFGLAALGAGLR